MPSATACLPQPEEHLQRETLQFPTLYPYHPLPPHPIGTPAAQPPHQSKVFERRWEGVRGREEGNFPQKVSLFPPPLFLPRTQKRAGPQAHPFNGTVSPCYFMRNFMGSRDSEGKNRSRNNTSTSTMRKGAMFRTRLPILMFPMPQTT